MKKSKVKVFYTPNQVNTNRNIIGATSRSPLKPMLLMKAFEGLGFSKHMDVVGDFEPFTDEDFKLAHQADYVHAFFNGLHGCQSNGLPWSQELADSVRYTNASLYNALRHAYVNPDEITFSPTSGFHHARPEGGSGFCTFSGQAIAAIKLYNEFGISGAVLDLDGHYGNSIEDTRYFSETLNLAIPRGFNFAQLRGHNKEYHESLINALSKIETAVLENKIHYVLWAHGADSHEDDDLGGQVSTNYWVKCSETFYSWVAEMDKKLAELGRGPLPVAMSLFGGYRKDSYGSVLSLHVKDMQICMNTLCGHDIKYKVRVDNKIVDWRKRDEQWIDGLPVSLLRMIEPRNPKYFSDEKFKATRLSKNEAVLLEFMKNNPDKTFTGFQLGYEVKKWVNHSMGKWAKRLVRRGLIKAVDGRKGYMFTNTIQNGHHRFEAASQLGLNVDNL